MQGAAIAYAPSLSPSANPRKLAAARFNPFSLSPSEKLRFGNGSSLSFPANYSARKLSPVGCSLKQGGWISDPNLGGLETESDGVRVRAAAESAGEAESPKLKSFQDTLVLGTLFGFWYLFNIYFNIYNKQVYPFSPFSYKLLNIVYMYDPYACKVVFCSRKI